MTEGTGSESGIDPSFVYPPAPPAPEPSAAAYRGLPTDAADGRRLAGDLGRRPDMLAAGLTDPGRRLGAAVLDLVLFLVTLGLGWLVWALIVFRDGRTPGKQLLSMRVVHVRTGVPLGWGMMFVREILVRGLLIPMLSAVTLGIGGLVATLMIFSPLHQTLWDRFCDTTVADG
jgi:uncharacterized RDD family membrane protein YckC